MMPSVRDLKGRPLEEALTSRDDVTLGAGEDEDGISTAIGRTITVADNPHRDEIAAAREKAMAARANRPPRVPPTEKAQPPPDAPRHIDRSGPDPVPLPEDFEAGLVALETCLSEMRDKATQALDLCASLRARAEVDHEKLTKVESLIAALRG